MAPSATRNKYIYLLAFIGASLLLAFNIAFNVKSTHHHITTFIPDNPSQHITSKNHPSNQIKQNDINTNNTKYLINIINNKLKHHENSNNNKTHSNCNLLFCDKHKFDLMVSYYTSISSINFPSSWIELNDQLFCPIKYSSELNHNLAQISSAGQRLLKYIYANQFKSNCLDPNNKYLFFDTTGWYSGLGATTNGGILKYFTRALMSNRTFIMIGEWDWSKTKHCIAINRTGFYCYFLPTSNCKYDDVIAAIDINDNTQFRKQRGVPKECNIGDFPDKPWCTARVLHIIQRGAGWYPKNEDIDNWIHGVAINYHSTDNHLLFANFQQYKSVIVSFVYRLQPNVREIIYNKIRNAFIKSFNNIQELNDQFDPFTTIGFPIRASDKCKDNIMGLHGEMECWEVEEIDKILHAIRYLKPSINSVIFTSEDMYFIDKLIDKMNETDNKWNIIINHDDTKPAIGSAKFRTDNYKGMEIDDTADSDFEHDVIVGALSSLLLQTSNSKYIVHTKSSSWVDNLWNIGSQLNCESIFWSEQMEIKGFGDDIDWNGDNDDKPAFLHNNNKKYHYFDKFCFELKQQGLLNKKVKWKHILFPPDIWEQIHVLHLNPKRFKQKFGIDIWENGWNHYCDRYTKPPFVLRDDVGV